MLHYALVLGHLGYLAFIIGLSMATSIIWAIIYHENPVPFVEASAIACIAGLILYYLFRDRRSLSSRDGFALVGMGWVVASLLGTLPYLLTGTFTTFSSAFFETVSGFTTTGASVVKDVEALPYSVLWWRSLTHWLGGMGIMSLFVAIIADIGGRSNQIFHAEVPGPINDKVSPRVGESARLLWFTYVALSAAQSIMLMLGGMSVFDSLCHTFGTLATGGFSTRNASLGYYNSYCQWVTIAFMFLAGANFALHYTAWHTRSLKGYARSSEFKTYAIIVLLAALLVVWNIRPGFASVEETIRTALFQVVSIITTTGFATADFNQWPDASRLVLLVLMLIGGCAGSTAGAIKVGRFSIMATQSKIELRKMIHPRAVIPLRTGGEVIDQALLNNVLQFFFLYMVMIALSTVVMSFLGLDLITSLSAVIACLGNVGPGLGQVGPAGNYALVPAAGKVLLSFLMLFGRLEIFILLILAVPEFWRR